MTSTVADRVMAAAAVLGPGARRDAALGPMTTYRVGGRAALLATLSAPADLDRLARALAASELPTLVLGRGSNMLVADTGFPGLAVALGDTYAGVDIDGATVRAGGAAPLPVVARRTAAVGLRGFEWAVGVPGSVGGGVRMNAGGHGSDIAATLVGVRLADLRSGDHGWVPATDLDLGYRRSAVAAHHVVVEAELALAPGAVGAAEALVADIVRWRRDNQPGGQNAGSVFTNPPGDSAGRLIDVAGCKGLRIDTAVVSPKHANFFIADEGGRADDVYALMGEVRRRVLDATGVRLETETCLVGFG